jgi:integrase/recombinase XerD
MCILKTRSPTQTIFTMPDLITPPPAPLAAPDGTISVTNAPPSPAAVYLAQLAPSGRRTMQQALDTIARLLGQQDALSCPWASLRYQHTQALRTALQERYAPATANKMLAALRRVLKECWQLGLMTVEEYSRAAAVKVVKADTLPKGRALTLNEVTALLEACARDSSPAGVRDSALIALMAGSGPRRSEVAALEVADYDPSDGCVTIRNGKGNKDRRVYVSGGAKVALDDWMVLRGRENGALFTSTTRADLEAMTDQAVLVILKRRAKESGVAPFSPHDLRRTMITRLLENGADLLQVQQLAGHADVSTTSRYDRRGEQAKKDAAARLQIPHVPNMARRTLPLDDPGPEKAGRADRDTDLSRVR